MPHYEESEGENDKESNEKTIDIFGADTTQGGGEGEGSNSQQSAPASLNINTPNR